MKLYIYHEVEDEVEDEVEMWFDLAVQLMDI
jgi:hypothetical protein